MKFRITMTIVNEYTVTKKDLEENYPGIDNFEDVLAIDIAEFEEDPTFIFDNGKTKVKVEGIILKK